MGLVDRMKVGQALEKRFVSPTNQTTPGSYLRAIDEESKTVKTATGQPRIDFGDIFNPRERATIQEIGGLLERQLAAKNPVQPTVLQGKDIASEATSSLPSILSRPVVIANWVIKTLTSGHSSLESKIDKINAFRLLNPDKFVEAMQETPPTIRQQVFEQLAKRHGVKPVGTGLIAPAAIGSSSDEINR
jgi:hypothetical protein